MSNIRVHKPNGALFFDFRFQGERCREYTALADTASNRKKLEKILNRIESEIAAGTFVYANYFPNSKALLRLGNAKTQAKLDVTDIVGVVSATTDAGLSSASKALGGQLSVHPVTHPVGPDFKTFALKWFDERSIEWRRSHIKSLLSTLNGHLIGYFGDKVVGSISKSDVLAFRATLAKVKGRGNNDGLSAKRINEIMGLLRQILNEAADRFEFTSPTTNIKKLKQRKTDVDPFGLDDMQRIIATVRPDYKHYFTVRFLTGMRTGEVHGLKWKYIDFDLRVIRVRETYVLGEDEYTKTDGSQRDIYMSQPVWDALKAQYQATSKVSEYVFCNLEGLPIDNKNFSDRVWYPLLRHLDLKARRPYQMRHTAATLWLAAGEAPEWIARQLGHTSTEMLFRVYSRYVPNLTRQDGSAMERLLASKLSQGPLIEHQDSQGQSAYVPVGEASPQPVPKPRGIYGVRKPERANLATANSAVIPNGQAADGGDKMRSMTQTDSDSVGLAATRSDNATAPILFAAKGSHHPAEAKAPSPMQALLPATMPAAMPVTTPAPLSWADMANHWMAGQPH